VVKQPYHVKLFLL